METNRPTNQYLEDILEKEFPCLDHGFVRTIDYMGDESSITQAARVSYGTGTKSVSEDKNLIRYLLRHQHTTPFEMVEIKFHMKMPIFVARQFIRHRMASVNEYSARYSILDKEFYIPKVEDIQPQATDNKQGRSGELTHAEALKVQDLLMTDALNAYKGYELLLNENNLHDSYPGIARELARMNLTLGYYTQWYWKIDGNNLLKMLALRTDSHAQKEIRVYADVMENILSGWMPNVYEAYNDYMKCSFTMSNQMLTLLHDTIDIKAIQEVDYKKYNVTKREYNDLIGAIFLGE